MTPPCLSRWKGKARKGAWINLVTANMHAAMSSVKSVLRGHPMMPYLYVAPVAELDVRDLMYRAQMCLAKVSDCRSSLSSTAVSGTLKWTANAVIHGTLPESRWSSRGAFSLPELTVNSCLKYLLASAYIVTIPSPSLGKISCPCCFAMNKRKP